MMLPLLLNLLLILILLSVILSALLIILYTLICGISPMPTSRKAKSAILSLLKKYGKGIEVMDLGSGWGSTALAVAVKFPHYRVKGYERSPIPFLVSLILLKIIRRSNCRFFRKNFFDCSLKDTDIVLCYLCTPLMAKLKPKLECDLDSGALVISGTFAVPGWRPVETVTLDDLYKTKIYVYRYESQKFQENCRDRQNCLVT